MQINKFLLKFLFLTIVFYSSFLFCAQAATNKYISATVAISANGFSSLERAFKNVKPQLKALGLITVPYNQTQYHMTLAGFNIDLSPSLSPKQQRHVVKQVRVELSKAAHDALSETLTHIKQKQKGAHAPVILTFEQIRVFQKKIVAIFNMSGLVQKLVDKIEAYFQNNIKKLRTNGSITCINKHQTILQPHVSVARITNQHQLFGRNLTPTIAVADFHIGNATSIISVQLR